MKCSRIDQGTSIVLILTDQPRDVRARNQIGALGRDGLECWVNVNDSFMRSHLQVPSSRPNKSAL